ncbi:MAG: NADH-quinone oxidoreductase subunit N, partial [Thermoanaerobaculia bacterium]
MSQRDLMSLLPEIVLTGGGVLILLLDAIVPKMRRAFTPLALLVTVLAALAVTATSPLRLSRVILTWNGLLETSAVTTAFSLIVLAAAFLSLLASQAYLRREGILAGEYHALLLWCVVGLLLMLRSTELLTVFVALELFSMCLYCLAAFHRRISIASEAAIKYFLMGAFVSAFVLYGIALVYGATGSTRVAEIGRSLATAPQAQVFASLGLLLLVAGFGFKMSLVPFHAWSPDTYQGAPSP